LDVGCLDACGPVVEAFSRNFRCRRPGIDGAETGITPITLLIAHRNTATLLLPPNWRILPISSIAFQLADLWPTGVGRPASGILYPSARDSAHQCWLCSAELWWAVGAVGRSEGPRPDGARVTRVDGATPHTCLAAGAAGVENALRPVGALWVRDWPKKSQFSGHPRF